MTVFLHLNCSCSPDGNEWCVNESDDDHNDDQETVVRKWWSGKWWSGEMNQQLEGVFVYE